MIWGYILFFLLSGVVFWGGIAFMQSWMYWTGIFGSFVLRKFKNRKLSKLSKQEGKQ